MGPRFMVSIEEILKGRHTGKAVELRGWIYRTRTVGGKAFLLDVRHLWVRSQRMTTIFRILHTVFGAVHQYFRDQGFWEVSPPMITPAGSEGGATLFEVEYFGRKAYLTQSWQLYAEALVLA